MSQTEAFNAHHQVLMLVSKNMTYAYTCDQLSAPMEWVDEKGTPVVLRSLYATNTKGVDVSPADIHIGRSEVINPFNLSTLPKYSTNNTMYPITVPCPEGEERTPEKMNNQVSRIHAFIKWAIAPDSGITMWMLQCIGKNGATLQGEFMRDSELYPLHHRDRVVIAGTAFFILLSESEAAKYPPRPWVVALNGDGDEAEHEDGAEADEETSSSKSSSSSSSSARQDAGKDDMDADAEVDGELYDNN
jgi:hypothetical protein